MNEPYIRVRFKPELSDPVLLSGLPGLGNVGKIVAHLLIEFLGAQLFAELYAPSFPDFVFIDEEGVCRPPRYEFFVSQMGRGLIILTGDFQPSLDDVPAHYEVCNKVLDFVCDLGCNFIVTIGGAPASRPLKEIYVAATSHDLALEYMEKGAVIYGNGKIMGASGLLIGLAKKRGMKGICLLGSTTGVPADREAAFNVFRFLTKIFRSDLGVNLEKSPY
ncbi:proteasome assembly chaperone family protein [Candidatus Bathyarchaeota archaeon]|nr:MAG: proteasome assembly chaperone family protein [Candidatus Bathyarchaeota archaeon]